MPSKTRAHGNRATYLYDVRDVSAAGPARQDRLMTGKPVRASVLGRRRAPRGPSDASSEKRYHGGHGNEPSARKKPLTAEIAESAEKKTLRILGVLCVLCGRTRLFHPAEGLRRSSDYDWGTVAGSGREGSGVGPARLKIRSMKPGVVARGFQPSRSTVR